MCDDANVDPVIQLAITLRMLAGGSYLDIAFGYDVGLSSVHAIFKKVLVAIDNNVDNIQFPVDCEQALRDLEETFCKISKGVFRGTVAAGDVHGNVRSFYCRKGFYGHAVQAFCDGNCIFNPWMGRSTTRSRIDYP